MSIPAPWAATTPARVAAVYAPVLELELVPWLTAAAGDAFDLEVVTATLSQDESWTPRYSLEATVVRTPAVNAADPRDGWLVHARGGYGFPDAPDDVQDAARYLMVRELVPIIGSGTSRLSATGAEAPLVDAQDEDLVAGFITFSAYITDAAVPAVFEAGTVLGSWWASAAGRNLEGGGVAQLGVNKQGGTIASWWEPFRAGAELKGWGAYCDRLGRITTRPVPTAYGAVVEAFHDGDGGTVLEYAPSRSLEDYANEVWVEYGDNTSGHADGASLTGRPRVTRVIDRGRLEGVAAADRTAAAETALRRLRAGTGAAELRTALTLWVNVWDTVTVTADGEGPATMLVASASHRFPSGESTFGLRPV